VAQTCSPYGDRHLSLKRGIFRLKLFHFDDLLVGNELTEVAVVGVQGRRPYHLGRAINQLPLETTSVDEGDKFSYALLVSGVFRKLLLQPLLFPP